MNPEVERQLSILCSRSVDLHARADLARKLEHSLATNQPLRVKLGADPSSPDIHLGHVVCLNKLREFQDLGHLVVFIVGDFTGMIGDPSGKSKTRPQLTRAEVDVNAQTYQEQVFQVLDPARTEIRRNSEWFGEMNFEHVIRLAAKVTVAQMLQRDDFSKRYAANQPISLVEFLYPLVQAYDSVMVKADVELGGTDQLFNLLLGRELQKEYGQDPQVVMTMPLIEGLDGVQKMSKSLGNYIAVKDTPKEMFGKVMSISDDLMWRYWALLACEPEAGIAARRAEAASGARNPRYIKEDLAKAIIRRFHPAEAADHAAREFAEVFAKGNLPEDIPVVSVPANLLADGTAAVTDLMVLAGMVASKGEARRLIQQGGVHYNDARITDIAARINPSDGGVLKAGKRRFARFTVA